MIFLDTHVLLFLQVGGEKKISKKARQRIESEAVLYYSPIVRLELSYLEEIGRIRVGPEVIISSLERQIGLKPSPHSFAEVCKRAERIGWTRDVFDRLIVADAMCANAPLVTKDDSIHQSYKKALW